MLTDHRLSKCNPFRGISDDVNAKGLTSPKGRGTPTAKDLRAERKIEMVEGMERIDAIED